MCSETNMVGRSNNKNGIDQNLLLPEEYASYLWCLLAFVWFCSSNSNSAGINVLCGVGILSTPFAAKEGGWCGLFILVLFSLLSCYTGILLRYCLDSEPGLQTYPDIGQAAFGTIGRFAVSVSTLVNSLPILSDAASNLVLESPSHSPPLAVI